MYPLKFEPLLKSVVWGGDEIVPYKGIESTSKNVGESWELSAVSGNESVVANGEFGTTLGLSFLVFGDKKRHSVGI